MKKALALSAAAAGIVAVLAAVWIWQRPDAGNSQEQAPQGAEATQLHACGMHPQHVQVGPGRCPICGMNLTPLPQEQQPQPAAPPAEVAETAQLHACSMHPQHVQAGPGSCPICGMNLTPLPREQQPQPAAPPAASTEAADLYTCGMHPQHVQAGPGRCPICGMNLTPVPRKDEPDAQFDPSTIRVSSNFAQNFAVRTAEARRGSIATEIRTVGYLEDNEEMVVAVSTKFPGWIERSHVNTIGEAVTEGDVLLEIYSPELVTSQNEFLAAIEYAAGLRSREAHEEAVKRAEALVQAAGERLRSWDLTEAQIDALRERGEAGRTIEIHAPASGILVEKAVNSLEGMRVTPGTAVIKIADHSTLWVKVEFHEHSLKNLRAGLRADISLDAYPGQQWDGTVLFFQPEMNPMTQTLAGYIEVDNPLGTLRPKMYADIHIHLPAVTGAVIIPAEAVLHTGDRSVVIMANDDGTFTPRSIAPGIESDGDLQVLDGVEAGERLVTSSQFLFDSESNLRSAISQLLETGGQSMPGHHHH